MITAAIRLLELAGGEPRLRVAQFAFPSLDAVLQETHAAPCFRLIELTSPDDQGLTWEGVLRLRQKALKLLHSSLMHDGLQEDAHWHWSIRWEVSSAPRLLQSTIGALKAQAEISAPMWVLDIAIPPEQERTRYRETVARWTTLLTDTSPATPRRVLRGPPQPAQEDDEDMLDRILRQTERFRDSVAVGIALARTTHHSNPKMVATRARQKGRIFGVWDGNAYRYPDFQFDAAGQPLSDTAALVEVLPHDADGSGRSATLWLFAPDPALGMRTPADVFRADPQRVIALAWQRRGNHHAKH